MKNFVLVFLLVFISCNANPNCNSELNIDPVVLDNAAEAGINYCKLVNNCLEGDAQSIKELFLEPKDYLDGGSLFLHFSYLYQITKNLGEDLFIRITKGLTKQEIEQLYFSIELGVKTLGNGATVESEFPELYKKLWNNEVPKFKSF